jgi:hypothetical protein
MSATFPNIANIGGGKLYYQHDYIRRIWLKYETSKPVIVQDKRVRIKQYRDLAIVYMK